MADITTPYAGAVALRKPTADWLNDYDAQRLAAYDLYEDMYWNNPNTYELVMRGDNETPIYLPTARLIINTLNRYVMRNYRLLADPALGSDTERAEITTWYEAWFRREKFRSKFNTAKMYGLIRGDAAFYISADELKPEGSRVSITELDPRSVFPITDEEDDEVVLGVEIIEQIVSTKEQDKVYIRRQSWYKTQCPQHPAYNETTTEYDGEIAYSLRTLEVEGWNGDQPKYAPGSERIDGEIIPGIYKLPVYYWRSGTPEPGNPWGNSELRGLETIATGVNQAISDQDLALAIAGLGMWVTDAGKPADGQPWYIGPQEVIEVAPGRDFKRIGGITSIAPSKEHIEMLQDQAFRVSGASDVAQGRVDVSVAESGIALQLRMGPILDEAALRDQEIIDCVNQMLYDLNDWFEAFESQSFGETATYVISAGDKLPANNDKWVETLLSGLAQQPPLFSQQYVWSELRKLGREIPPNMLEQIVEETEAYAAAADAYGGRLDEEGDGSVDTSAEEDVPEEQV